MVILVLIRVLSLMMSVGMSVTMSVGMSVKMSVGMSVKISVGMSRWKDFLSSSHRCFMIPSSTTASIN